MTFTEAQVGEAIRGTLGWRWERNGRTPGATDCFGYVRMVLERLGVELPDYRLADGSEDWHLDFIRNYHKHATEIPLSELRAGDVLFIVLKERCHIGVMLNQLRVIHMTNHHGVVIQDIRRPPLSTAVLSGYRVRGASNG